MIRTDCRCQVEISPDKKRAKIHYCLDHTKFDPMPPRLPGKPYTVKSDRETLAMVTGMGIGRRKFKGKTAIRDAQAHANDLNEAYLMGYRVGWYGMAEQGNLFHGPLENSGKGEGCEEVSLASGARSPEASGGAASG